MGDESGRLLEGKMRRQALLARDPGYVRAMAAQRTGSCNGCGVCCRLLFACPYYIAGTGCTAYGGRSEVCRAFPIDQRDLDDIKAAGGACSFAFNQTASSWASIGARNGSMINEALVDRFTAVHGVVGFAGGAFGMPFWFTVVGSLVFEILENLLQPKMASLFPYTAERDSPMNSSFDTLAVIAGWYVGNAACGRR